MRLMSCLRLTVALFICPALRVHNGPGAAKALDLSAELGVHEAIVHQILSGKLSGTRGDARRVKVRLGMVRDDMSALDVVTAALKKGAA